MIKGRWNPCAGRMTVITIIAAVNVIEIFTAGNNTIMTGVTATNHLCVIDNNGRHPGDDAVAVLTGIR